MIPKTINFDDDFALREFCDHNPDVLGKGNFVVTVVLQVPNRLPTPLLLQPPAPTFCQWVQFFFHRPWGKH
jgi:hypothetical protein